CQWVRFYFAAALCAPRCGHPERSEGSQTNADNDSSSCGLVQDETLIRPELSTVIVRDWLWELLRVMMSVPELVEWPRELKVTAAAVVAPKVMVDESERTLCPEIPHVEFCELMAMETELFFLMA